MAFWSHHFMGNRWGNIGNIERLYFFVLQNLCRWWLQPWNWKMLAPWKKSYDQPRHHIKKQKHYFANKGPSSQSYGFFSSHVWMWELDYKESWVPKNWDFWTVVLEKTLESPLDCKEINPKWIKSVSPLSRVFSSLDFSSHPQPCLRFSYCMSLSLSVSASLCFCLSVSVCLSVSLCVGVCVNV